MDYQVKSVQEWLLERYRGKPEFDAFTQNNNFRANGYTGNNTMRALRYALQYELGIPGPTGNFGPGTLAKTPTVSKDKQPSNHFISKILKPQCGVTDTIQEEYSSLIKKVRSQMI